MQKEDVTRYVPIIILLALVTVSFFIVRSYIVALIGAFILAYLIHPIHTKLHKKMPSSIAASITIAITLAILLIPVGWVISQLIAQTYTAIQNGAITNIITSIENLQFIQDYNINIREVINRFFSIGLNSLSKITVSVAGALVSLFVMVFAMYYLLLEWNAINRNIKKYIPFAHKDKLIEEIADATKKMVHGTLFIAIIEFVIAAIGFWLAGTPFFLVLATLIALFAFIPGGPGLIWIPVLIIEIVQQNYVSAGIILAFGLFISIYIDTIFRTKVAGKNARIHPVIVLLGILGGTPVFGLAGIVIGPLFLSYTLEILEEVLSIDHDHKSSN